MQPIVEETDNQSSQTSLPICYECLAATPIVWCLNCSVDYCLECWKRVHTSRALANHHKVPIDEKPRDYQRCTIHSDEKLQYWCSCDTLICVDCQLTKQHQHHTNVSVVDAAQDIIEEVKHEFQELQTCLTQAIDQGKCLQEKNTYHNIESVTTLFHSLRKTIDTYEEKLKTKIRQIEEKNNLLIDRYLLPLHNKEITLANNMRAFENLIAKHEYTHVLKIKQYIADYITDLMEEMEEMEELVLPTRTEYRIIGMNHVQKNIDEDLKNVRIVEQTSENYEFSLNGTYRELGCKGRPCILCGKCRDWYYTSDLTSWQWIRNHKDWKDDDWKNWIENRIWEHFERRDGSTCCSSCSSIHIFVACLCEDNM